MKRQSAKYRKAKLDFRLTRSRHRLSVFRDLPTFPPTAEEIETCVETCADMGIACVVPRLPTDLKPCAELIPQIAAMYAQFAACAGKAGITVGFHMSPVIEQSFYLTLDTTTARATRTQQLIRREYYCDPGETLHLKIHDGTLMALVIYDDEHADSIDLRAYVKDGYLDYTVPDGNWTVEEYLCTPDPLSDEPPAYTCNLLSSESGTAFLNGLADAFGDVLKGEPGGHIKTLYVTDLCFHAPNRRNWDPAFNRVFTERFGFDPAPYYPALYHDIGEKKAHIKSLFMDCRAEMLRSGMLCALKAFTDRHGMSLIVSTAEPKLPACSWLSGDALANQVFSPCAVQERSYLYGMNSTHLAASAADNYGSQLVCCEMFRDYGRLDTEILYKDTLNVFGHGANLLIAHVNDKLPLYKPSAGAGWFKQKRLERAVRAYPDFVARVQAMLYGGSRINDIAMLYPIYALHDKVYLYEVKTDGRFEYPHTPFSCNYMSILGTLSTYAGQDITMLHPQVLNRNCTVENGVIHLRTTYQSQPFRVLILPGADMVSLENMRMVKAFYDGGGKVIAVGVLPTFAFEFDADCEKESSDPDDFRMFTEGYGTRNDRELREIVRYIFGPEAVSSDVIKEFFYNTNEAGGEAYFLSSGLTGADGSEIPECTLLSDALQSFRVPLDVYMPDMPRFESFGAFNNAYTEFARLGLLDHIPGGGMISHIHKHRDGMEIYFFSNTTDRTYDNFIYLRGVLAPHRWDPHTGHTSRLLAHYVRYRGETYTRVRLHLPSGHGVFLVSGSVPPADRIRITEASGIIR